MINLQIGTEEIRQIIYEWTGKRPTKPEARRILYEIHKEAEERLRKAAFEIITQLADRL